MNSDGGLFSWLYTPFWRPASHADNPWLIFSCFAHQVHFLTPDLSWEDSSSTGFAGSPVKRLTTAQAA